MAYHNRASAFFKADVQNVRIGVELNVRFWPKAAIRERNTDRIYLGKRSSLGE